MYRRLRLTGIFRFLFPIFAMIAGGPSCFLAPAGALELTIVASETPTAATVITRTNNKGYNVVFWNFTLPASFTGTGEANTVTSLSFQFYQNSPQSGTGVIPQNIAIYSGFFDPTKYSTVQGSNLFKPVGNSYSTPVSTPTTPPDGINTVQIADTASGQLNMGTLTPGVNEPYKVHDFRIPTTQNPFNGTTGNVNGQYSIVIWTESTQNYQWKSGGQLALSIPGVSGILSSSTPGYLDAVPNTPVTTLPGALAPAPVPEPSTYILVTTAVMVLGIAEKRRRRRQATCR